MEFRTRVTLLSQPYGFKYVSYIGMKPLGSWGSPPIAAVTDETSKAPPNPLDPEAQAAAPIEASSAHYVRLVAGLGSLTFEGIKTSWEDLPELLKKVPDRPNTVLEFATSGNDLTIAQAEALQSRVIGASQPFGFKYVSNIGNHPMGSKGSAQTTGNHGDALEILYGDWTGMLGDTFVVMTFGPANTWKAKGAREAPVNIGTYSVDLTEQPPLLDLYKDEVRVMETP